MVDGRWRTKGHGTVRYGLTICCSPSRSLALALESLNSPWEGRKFVIYLATIPPLSPTHTLFHLPISPQYLTQTTSQPIHQHVLHHR